MIRPSIRAYALLFALGGAALLSGCLTINTGGAAKPDPLLEARLARLEASLTASSAPSTAPPEERLAHIEAQIEKEQKAVEAAVVAPAPTTPEQISAPDAPLVTRDAELVFKDWSDGMLKMGEKLQAKFTETSTKGTTSNRDDLVGQPLRQQRFLGPTGDVIDLGDYKGSRNVVLVFMRGFSGQVCIACSAQTLALASHIQDFRDRNAEVVVVYPGSAASVPVFIDAVRNLSAEGRELPFPVLLDVNLNAVNVFDIKGSLARPTSMIVDTEGIVRYAYAGKNFDDRPSIKTLREELDRLQAANP